MTESRRPGPGSPQQHIRVLIVDDSAPVRAALSEIIAADIELSVMATASDPYEAADKIREEVPDVIILDTRLKRMDGLTFMGKIMSQHPIPMLVCSSLDEEALEQVFEAGAVEVIARPDINAVAFLQRHRLHICDLVKLAARTKSDDARKPNSPRPPAGPKLSADIIIPPRSAKASAAALAALPVTQKIVCIGASTGGTEALRVVLESLSPECPGIVVVQHMPEKFTAAFASRLNGLCEVQVSEAEDGAAVLPGHVLIAPGNRHMLLRRSGTHYSVHIVDGPHISGHRPSVDVLFRSAAQQAGANAMGILLTGMGDDGAQGLLEMKTMGSMTIAQDEQSCVVFGMPREAIDRGAASQVLPLDKIAAKITAIHRTSGEHKALVR